MNGFELLNKLNFERTAGSENELKAAKTIAEMVEGNIEEFDIPFSKINKCEMDVDGTKYEATGYHLSGNIDEELDIVVVDSVVAVNYLDLANKCALIPTRINYQFYEALAKANVKAIVGTSGTLYDDLEKTDLEENIIRPRHLKFGQIPCFTIRTLDLNEIVKNRSKKIRLILDQTEITLKSHNVVSVIKGEKEEEICFTAHYDSVRFSKGIYDNLTGSATILGIYNYFKDKTPKYTLRFVWCGAEERGLLGSKAYTKDHETKLNKILLNINVDMTAPLLGYDLARVSAGFDIVHYIDAFSKKVGFPIEVKQGVYSSDSTPFADAKVPALSFARINYPNGCQIHSNLDNGDFLDEGYYNNTLEFIIALTNEILSSRVYPLSREVPANVLDDIQKYYGLK